MCIIFVYDAADTINKGISVASCFCTVLSQPVGKPFFMPVVQITSAERVQSVTGSSGRM
jgi:hypothetical protein